jgi:hypothetical protein
MPVDRALPANAGRVAVDAQAAVASDMTVNESTFRIRRGHTRSFRAAVGLQRALKW